MDGIEKTTKCVTTELLKSLQSLGIHLERVEKENTRHHVTFDSELLIRLEVEIDYGDFFISMKCESSKPQQGDVTRNADGLPRGKIYIQDLCDKLKIDTKKIKPLLFQSAQLTQTPKTTAALFGKLVCLLWPELSRHENPISLLD